MGSDDAERMIASLREHFGVQTDADLARRLRIDKSTVSSWRSRGTVPARFARILEGESNQFALVPPAHWGEHEIAAFEVALFRFCRLYSGSRRLSDYRSALEMFSGDAYCKFLSLMMEAQQDLVDRQVGTSRALLIHADLEAGEAAIDRDKTGSFHTTYTDPNPNPQD